MIENNRPNGLRNLTNHSPQRCRKKYPPCLQLWELCQGVAIEGILRSTQGLPYQPEEGHIKDSGDSWMYPYQRTPMGNPYISPIWRVFMGYNPQESLGVPHKYHRYTVRVTPNCPLKDMTLLSARFIQENEHGPLGKKIMFYRIWHFGCSFLA